ncbi:MAG: sodium/proton-translocating pyrophosphatase, partial [Patescibacteria group bacterium]
MLEYFPILISFVSLFFVWWLVSWIKKQSIGTAKMQEIASFIKEGSNAFLKRQYRTIGFISLILTAALFLVYFFAGDFE